MIQCVSNVNDIGVVNRYTGNSIKLCRCTCAISKTLLTISCKCSNHSSWSDPAKTSIVSVADIQISKRINSYSNRTIELRLTTGCICKAGLWKSSKSGDDIGAKINPANTMIPIVGDVQRI